MAVVAMVVAVMASRVDESGSFILHHPSLAPRVANTTVRTRARARRTSGGASRSANERDESREGGAHIREPLLIGAASFFWR
jgi:hypothetical protein